jgi:REP element-mobilizing transposase RayT
MPRASRKKGPEYSYHIMCRSISEVNLFQDDDDKKYYLSLLKRYSEKHKCDILAFCLMNNHVHLFINPRGFDISIFMHCLNSAYVSYFNRRNKRHGHLFQGRFASTIVDSDVYALTLSAYIHNNPKDIEGYYGREEDYPYSSYGIYIGKRKDEDCLVNTEFILSVFGKDLQKAALKYHGFAVSMKETGIMRDIGDEIWNAYVENQYRSEKSQILRDKNPDEIVEKACELLNINVPQDVHVKYCRENVGIRAFVTYVMRVMCGYTYKKIGEYIGDLSLSGIANLFNKGFRLTKSEKVYGEAFLNMLS